MYLYFLIIWTYIKSLFEKIKLNKYLYLTYDNKDDKVKIVNVSFIYNVLKFMYIYDYDLSKQLIKKYYNIDPENRLIVINSIEQILPEGKDVISPIIPKGIISNIVIDVKNHRYNLNTLKKNLFKIDKETPIIFCLLYYENICKIENVNLSVNYFGKDDNDNKFIKINDIDKISVIINNT